jgi:GNAT superfamily N-acetyltransferase
LITELAEYEKLTHEMKVNEAILKDSLFNRKAAEVLIGEYNSAAVSYAIFFHNFSTFVGKPGIYLEDIYVKPEFRHQGFGKIILSYLGKLAVERDCGRVEWTCLDWNQKSIDFYESQGAKKMDEWIIFRLTGEELKGMAEKF